MLHCAQPIAVYEQVDVSFCLYTPDSLKREALRKKYNFFFFFFFSVSPFHTPCEAVTPEV